MHDKYIYIFKFKGVKFLYDCVTGQRIQESYGCIMADEMVTFKSNLILYRCYLLLSVHTQGQAKYRIPVNPLVWPLRGETLNYKMVTMDHF